MIYDPKNIQKKRFEYLTINNYLFFEIKETNDTKSKKYFNNDKGLEKINKENIFNSVNDSFCLLFSYFKNINY